MISGCERRPNEEQPPASQHSTTRNIILIRVPHRHHPRSPQITHLPPQLRQITHTGLFLLITVCTERTFTPKATTRDRTIRASTFQAHRNAVRGVKGGIQSEDEAEGVFSIEVEAVETFLADETKGSVEGERRGIVMLSLEDNLTRQGRNRREEQWIKVEGRNAPLRRH